MLSIKTFKKYTNYLLLFNSNQFLCSLYTNSTVTQIDNFEEEAEVSANNKSENLKMI